MPEKSVPTVRTIHISPEEAENTEVPREGPQATISQKEKDQKWQDCIGKKKYWFCAVVNKKNEA